MIHWRTFIDSDAILQGRNTEKFFYVPQHGTTCPAPTFARSV